jgi:chromosomal replication initiator protein
MQPMAYAAALEAAEMPAVLYNPLFIYGKTGVGKTHLVHAIGNALVCSGRRVVYTNGQRLTNEFVLALKAGKIDDFNQKYRNIDALLFDDIQLLSGKTGTQECFASIFNDLFDSDCQIVISSDVVPKSIESFDEKLRSRMEGGLVVDIQPPDNMSRTAILKAKAEQFGVDLSPDAVSFLASRFPCNVRELEGA